MRKTLDVPEGDQFMTITEHDAANFRYGAAFGIARSDDLVFIQITVFNTRTVEQKKALFRRIAEVLGERPGIRAEDVFVNIVDAARENWSVGHGLAQFARDEAMFITKDTHGLPADCVMGSSGSARREIRHLLAPPTQPDFQRLLVQQMGRSHTSASPPDTYEGGWLQSQLSREKTSCRIGKAAAYAVRCVTC